MSFLNEKAQEICDSNSPEGMCIKQLCPLAKACEFQVGDNAVIWANRVNKAAKEVKS